MNAENGGGPIRSVDDVRQQLATILRRVNGDPRLALRAAANPLLALEELGYEIAPGVRPELERRTRHSAQVAQRLEGLQRQVYELAGEQFDLESPAELTRVLFERLELPRLPMRQQLVLPRDGATTPAGGEAEDATALPRHAIGRPKHPDPLEPLRRAHPVMEPLLEYRAIEASQPPLASRASYERLKRDDAPVPSLRVRFRFRRDGDGERPVHE